MYVENHEDILRQGDVLEQVWFTPAVFHKVKDDQFTLPQTMLRMANLVVVSHCCELTWYENPQGVPQPRRPYILVAPLSYRLPFIQGTEEYEMLLENGENRRENEPVQFFYYSKCDGLESEAIVDFSTVMPIRNALLKNIALKKLLQLDVKHRHLFRTKLHEYFSRIPEEEWEQVNALFPADFA